MMGERFRKTDSCGTAYTRIYELIEHPYSLNGVTTGISNIKAETINDGAVYNVAGQRVNKLSKGINIVNGKKIVK